mgnify:CR=1 FL=1
MMENCQLPPLARKGAARVGRLWGKLFCQSSLMAQAMDSTDVMVTPFSA